MPQFDPTSFASQFFWLVLMFVVLYLVVSLYAMPRLSEVLETRQRSLSGDLERANSLKVEAETTLEAYLAASSKARADAHSLIASTRNAAQVEAEEKGRLARVRLAEQIKGAEQRIAVARDAAIAEVGQSAGDVALLAVNRLAGVSLDRSTADEAVASVLKGAV